MVCLYFLYLKLAGDSLLKTLLFFYFQTFIAFSGPYLPVLGKRSTHGKEEYIVGLSTYKYNCNGLHMSNQDHLFNRKLYTVSPKLNGPCLLLLLEMLWYGQWYFNPGYRIRQSFHTNVVNPTLTPNKISKSNGFMNMYKFTNHANYPPLLANPN